MEDADIDVEDCSEDGKHFEFSSESTDRPENVLGYGQKFDADGINELLHQSDLDDASRLAVVRMLQEESRYFNRSQLVKRSAVVASKPMTSPSKRKVWTKEEKALFDEGLRRYGKNWPKISAMITSRTLQQVTSYGRLYFRNQEKNTGSVAKRSKQNSTKEIIAHIEKESTDDDAGSDIDIGSDLDSEITASNKAAAVANTTPESALATSDFYQLVSTASASASDLGAHSKDDVKSEQRCSGSTGRKRNVASGSKSEGVTVEHCVDGDRVLPSLPQSRIQAAVKAKPAGDVRNPFKLVPCRTFDGAAKQATFKVKAESHALVVMDVHAHMSRREVIGLLGGHYDPDTRTLSIVRAEPCRSLSTGLQCDMDPVSQATACDKLQGQGLQVIGWYHSHPTFAPQPSHRDLDTQRDFQGWFAKCESPFVGIIISPYLNSPGVSEHTGFVILNADGMAPFQLPIEHVLSASSSDILATLSLLIDSCQSERRGQHRQWLQKVVTSAERFFPEDEATRSDLLSNLTQYLERLNISVV